MKNNKKDKELEYKYNPTEYKDIPYSFIKLMKKAMFINTEKLNKKKYLVRLF